MEWQRAAEEADLRLSLGVLVGGSPVALFRTEEGLFALDDICSHEYSRLSEGEVEEGQVACAKHGSRFSLRTGEVTGFPATRPVKAWSVKVEEGWIWVSRRAD
jgi:nitrite reductase/ring-hydroxylating ferredoxin subunit